MKLIFYSSGECPEDHGWTNLETGCYKLFKEKKHKMSKNKAQELCQKENGYIAEVTTGKENLNLKLIFEKFIIPVWLGAHKNDGKEFTWNSGAKFKQLSLKNKNAAGKCLTRNAISLVVTKCDGAFFVLCEINHLAKKI